jgi:hypothetical protein
MAKKKSIKLSAQEFVEALDKIERFCSATDGLKDEHNKWCMDYAVIRLYRDFEKLMLEALAGSINHDPKTISSTVGFDFPKQLNLDVCKYLVVGTGYFDFKGRDGLIKLIKRFVPSGHFLLTIVNDSKYKDTLEQLSALRNFAAHGSERAKEIAVAAIGGERLASSGAWLRKNDRLKTLCDSLRELAKEIEKQATY